MKDTIRVNMKDTIRVASAQVSPIFLNKEKTIEKTCDVIKEAAMNKAKLVVFPEAFIPGYPDWVWIVQNSKSSILNGLYSELLENSISIQDIHTKQLCEIAKEHNIHVVIGINERNTESSGSSLYNSLMYIDNDGNILGKHRKLMPTGGERLIWAQGDGSTLQVFNTTFGKLGGLICWENFMPLARYAMYAWGTQILVTPTWDKSTNWLSSLQHIAREGGLFIINCCMVLKMNDIPEKYVFKKEYPDSREWINTGNSCIINPKGEIISGPVEAKEEILYSDIDLNQITASKRSFDVAGHYSRPDVFKFLVNRNPNKNIANTD